MKRNNLREYIRRIKYKQNWVFTVSRLADQDYYKLAATMVVPDITPPHKDICISSSILINSEMAESTNEELFKMHLADLILTMEKHEMHEWLILDGKYLYEPHPKQI